MTGLMTCLQQALAPCGIPCLRSDGVPVPASLPCLTWTAALTQRDSGTVTLTCWYRQDDDGLLAMLDRLGELFPAEGRALRDGAGQPVLLWPEGVTVLRDARDPRLQGGRMTLSLRLWPCLEVTE